MLDDVLCWHPDLSRRFIIGEPPRSLCSLASALSFTVNRQLLQLLPACCKQVNDEPAAHRLPAPCPLAPLAGKQPADVCDLSTPHRALQDRRLASPPPPPLPPRLRRTATRSMRRHAATSCTVQPAATAQQAMVVGTAASASTVSRPLHRRRSFRWQSAAWTHPPFSSHHASSWTCWSRSAPLMRPASPRATRLLLRQR